MSKDDDDLAGHGASFHVGVRSCELVEPVRAIGRHTQPAGGNVVEEGLQDVGVNIALELVVTPTLRTRYASRRRVLPRHAE
jgi:hypothetical protein